MSKLTDEFGSGFRLFGSLSLSCSESLDSYERLTLVILP